jgi:hypothetical protein
MKQLLHEIRHNPLLWLLAFVPVVFAAAKLKPEAHTLLFVLSVLAIVPLARLLSHATGPGPLTPNYYRWRGSPACLPPPKRCCQRVICSTHGRMK